jgi:hypothetical protein
VVGPGAGAPSSGFAAVRARARVVARAALGAGAADAVFLFVEFVCLM